MLGILATAEGEMTRPQAPDSFSNMHKQPLTMVDKHMSTSMAVSALNSTFHLALSSSKHSHRPLTQDGVDPSSQNRSVKRCLIEAIHYSILSRFPSRLFPPQFLFCPSLTAPRQKTRKTTQMKATMAFVCAKLLSNMGH